MVFTLLFATILTGAASSALSADAYPSRPIRMIVPVAPGGGGDITGRALAQKLAASFGQQVIVDNRAGAGGVLGFEVAARANPDGYTFPEATDK